MQETTEEIEMAVIGSLMLDYERATAELDEVGIRADMFHFPQAKTIFEAMLKLTAEKKPVDALTIVEQARGDTKISSWMQKAIEATPTAAHAGYYGQLFKQNHAARALRALLREATVRLDDEPADIVGADLLRLIERLDTDPIKDGITFAQATEKAVETFQRIAQGTSGIMTGLPYMDAAGGIQPGELIVVSGKAGSCKTTLAKQILSHVCGVEKIPSALLTFEMTEEQIAAQTLTDQSKTSYRKFMAGVATQSDWDRLFIAKAKTEKWPLAITARARTPSRLSAYVRKVVRRGAKLIVLDYLQACQPDANMAKANIEQQVTYASNTIRDLAVTLGVSFIVVSTESREGELRYSDAIRYDAWKWYRMIQPEENNQDNPVYHLEIKKLRFGVLPKGVRPLYRVGERLLSEQEWNEHTKKAKDK